MNSRTSSRGWLRPAACTLATAIVLALGQTQAHAQATPNVPDRMTYQGFLVDADGDPLGDNGTKNYDVIFKIYDDQNAGALLWAEQQTVTVDHGNFSVLLGEGADTGDPRPALSTLFKGASASDRFVQITVKGIGTGGANVDILPRLRLLTSPYAFLAQQAVKVVQENGTDLLTSVGNVVSLNGHFGILGNNSLEFGVGLTKQQDAGRVGYAIYTPGALDIVGAGTTGLNRTVKIWNEGGAFFTGPVSAPSFVGSGAGLTGIARLAGGNIFSGDQVTDGNLRVGLLQDTTVSSAGYGRALIFSGGPDVAASWNTDNSDPLWMARYNAAANASELRVSIGDDPGSPDDKFVVGTTVGSADFNQSGTWTPLMTLDARGFMGLGVSSPGYRLDVNGGVGVWGNNVIEFGRGLTKEVNAGKIGYGSFAGDALNIVGAGTTGSNRKVQIYSEGGMSVSGRLYADSYGNISTYTDYGLTFQAVANYARIFMADNKGKSSYWWRQDNGMVFATEGGTSQGGGATRYCVYDGDSNWDFSSDARLKKDVVDAESVLDRVLKVQLRRFHWKEEAEDTKKHMGVIAQELQPLFPDMVGEVEDIKTKEKTLTVGYSDFGMIAVKAVQELKAKHDVEVQELKDQIAELKTQMADVLRATAELRAKSDKSKITASVDR